MFAIYLCAIPIVIADCRYHRIPNIYLIGMLYVIGLERVLHGVSSMRFLAVCALLLVGLHIVCRVGMGDIKLIFLVCLALDLASFSQFCILLTTVALLALVTVLVQWLFTGDLPSSIAMAPSIFSATWLYLGARSAPLLQEYADALVNSW